MTKSNFMSILTGLLLAAPAHADVDSEDLTTKVRAIEFEYSENMREETSSVSYFSNLKMRDERKVGLGLSVGGTSGLMGATLEFNFEDADGVVAGFGTGPGYNSVSLAWKHSFEGGFVSPYTTAGYSRWYRSRGGDVSNESSILDRVLTDSEKKSGQFGTDFLTGSMGLQYNQLSGEFVGLSVFAELVALYEVKRSQLLPSGSVGALYFF